MVRRGIIICVEDCSELRTDKEYMLLMVSRNSRIAVMKMSSVADSCLPLERRSFTYRRNKFKTYMNGLTLMASYFVHVDQTGFKL